VIAKMNRDWIFIVPVYSGFMQSLPKIGLHGVQQPFPGRRDPRLRRILRRDRNARAQRTL
jgi:hypothetical protein